MRNGMVASVVGVGASISVAGACVAAVNRVSIRHLRQSDSYGDPVTVCIPARNEAVRLPELIADLRGQRGLDTLRVLILDDDSTDDTSAAATEAIAGDPRFELYHHSAPPPAGWTGKAASCRRLAELAGDTTATLVFLDADVRLTPDAIGAAVTQLHRSGAGLVAPWPLQEAASTVERRVQPLLCWSWASTLPVALANTSLRPSTAVACGQFLAFDAAAYRAIGGHEAVAASLTEDLDIARALRKAGYHTTLVGSGGLIRCRMYSGATELNEGYTRWLWAAYGSAAGSVAVLATAAVAFIVPPAAALVGSGRIRRWGLLGYGAAVAGRLLARSTERGGHINGGDVVDALQHPVSIALYARLSWRSHRARSRDQLSWKGRPLVHCRE